MRPVVAVVAAAAGLAHAASYGLVQFAQGQSFLDAFYFIGGQTPDGQQTANYWNNGDDFIANVTHLRQLNMLQVLANNNVKISVSNVPKIGYNEKRYSFRLNSRLKYGFGTVFVFDAVHMPWGCSMWPAYWTVGDDWPNQGEIDIMENVNRRTNNQVVFHSGGPCTLREIPDQVTGQQVLDDCQSHLEDDNNAGCALRDPNPASFGNGFNAAGGGIYVTEFTADQISVWFFARANIPAGLDTKSNATTIDTATLGKPVAKLTAHAGCNIAQEFKEQKIVINNSLCGDFAGEPPVLASSGCPVPANSTCYKWFVTGDNQPAQYADAYFEIVSHRIFQTTGATSSPAEPDGPTETPSVPPPGVGPPSTTTSSSTGSLSPQTQTETQPLPTDTGTDAAASIVPAMMVLAGSVLFGLLAVLA